jgi:maltose O-acetyltransferase
MLAGLPFRIRYDGLLGEIRKTKALLYRYNHTKPHKTKTLDRLIRKILGKTGNWVCVDQPFHCDFGTNISVGANFYANSNCTILDCGRVTIGDNVLFGPNVSVFTAGHPIHPESRRSRYQYGIEVSIGNDTWICGNVTINPGVRIGNNVVVASGSVVTKDIEDDALAAGNPCRVIRKITEADRRHYFKDREFDVDDYIPKT